MKNRFVEHEGAGMLIDLYHVGLASRTFDVHLQYGVWPTDIELINLCDGTDAYAADEEVRHGGGKVDIVSDCYRTVEVFREGDE